MTTFKKALKTLGQGLNDVATALAEQEAANRELHEKLSDREEQRKVSAEIDQVISDYLVAKSEFDYRKYHALEAQYKVLLKKAARAGVDTSGYNREIFWEVRGW